MPNQDRPDETEGKKPKFKIVDRRRINVDDIEAGEEPPEPETPEPASPPEAKPEEKAPPPSDKKGGEPESESREPDAAEDPLMFVSLVVSFIQTLGSVAYVRLGLVPHPQTQLIAKKLEEARKLIALLEDLHNRIRPSLPGQVNAEIERLVQDLKANYVSQL